MPAAPDPPAPHTIDDLHSGSDEVLLDNSADFAKSAKESPGSVDGGQYFDREVAISSPTRVATVIGRYRVTQLLGKGGYGVVYLAFDDTLQRPVAIKVPRGDKANDPGFVKTYLDEARLLASFDHSSIVRVFDCGTTNEGHPFVVSQYIDGADLSHHIQNAAANPIWTAEVMAAIADALHYAHQRRVVHRDVKPGNILLDKSGKAYLADFGLALRDENYGQGPWFAGTPRYMSPEQARGEGHRIDGRSDIYSLGVVLFELLTGQAPFLANDVMSLLDQIQSRDPTPPRQLADQVPAELERICLRALAKRVNDRYSSAGEMATELRYWLGHPQPMPTAAAMPLSAPVPSSQAASTPGASRTPHVESRAPVIVPKGLLAYDAKDADFFIDLLPGPRDRHGLPVPLRFWKDRLDERKLDDTFAVGLMFGPTGCGKSSLVRAGLIPRLDRDVRTVMIEATAEGTELRLLNGIRNKVVDHPDMVDLPNAMAWLRRRPTGAKVVIIIDQLEQWLFACPDVECATLVQALRHCDGGRVQALLMVRDDFWMPACRLFRALEVDLHEGHNSAAIDLFDKKHAQYVLSAFGRAYGRIDAVPTKEHNQFLERAVDELAENDRVVAVRLVLFAEMFKNKPWTVSSLRALGGATGIGVAYLDELFGPTAPKSRQTLAPTVTKMFEKLLPEAGGSLKGQAIPVERFRIADVDDRTCQTAIRLLDHDLHLITPTETESGQSGYQLAHDSMVPAIRNWLARENQQTLAGRAKQLLTERTALWSNRPDKRLLPTFFEWSRIRWFTKSREWNESQKRMMARADRRYVTGQLIALALGIAVAIATYQIQGRVRARSLVEKLHTADVTQVPEIVRQFAGLEQWVWPLVESAGVGDLSAEARINNQLAQDTRRPENLLALLDDDRPTVQATAALLLADSAETSPSLQEMAFDLPVNTLVYVRRAFASSKLRNTFVPLAKNLLARPHDGTESSARRRATAAVVLARYGDPTAVQIAVTAAAPPDVRTQVVHRMAAVLVPPSLLREIWAKSIDAYVRSALVLAAGEYDDISWPGNERLDFGQQLLQVYKVDVDPAHHAAIGWLLGQRWGKIEIKNDKLDYSGLAVDLKKVDEELAGQPRGNRKWFHDPQVGMMIVFDRPGNFEMGPRHRESTKKNEVVHSRRIDRRFAMAAHVVNLHQYHRAGFDYPVERRFVPNDLCPASPSWNVAAEYCNVLSEQAKLPQRDWCFERRGDGSYQLAPNYLQRCGYRLPTEAEWEYAARGNVDAARFYGSGSELVGKYAHIGQFQLSPVGRLKPNPFGLFDVFGNVHQWCLEQFPVGRMPFKMTGQQVNGVWTDSESPLELLAYSDVYRLLCGMAAGPDPLLTAAMGISIDDENRSLRGSTYYDPPELCYAARRFRLQPNFNPQEIGFRVVRTMAENE